MEISNLEIPIFVAQSSKLNIEQTRAKSRNDVASELLATEIDFPFVQRVLDVLFALTTKHAAQRDGIDVQLLRESLQIDIIKAFSFSVDKQQVDLFANELAVGIAAVRRLDALRFNVDNSRVDDASLAAHVQLRGLAGFPVPRLALRSMAMCASMNPTWPPLDAAFLASASSYAAPDVVAIKLSPSPLEIVYSVAADIVLNAAKAVIESQRAEQFSAKDENPRLDQSTHIQQCNEQSSNIQS
jgi:hypothetical protein